MTHGLEQRSARTLPGAIHLFFRFAVPLLFLATLAGWLPVRLWLADFSVVDLTIVAGVAIYWPIQEWVLHNYALHFTPRTVLGLRIDPWFSQVHRYHHRHPDVLERVFLPTGFIALISPVHWAAWLLLLPAPQAVTGILSLTLASLIYEWVHYLVHTPYKPQSAWFTRVRRNHMLHHFKNEHYWHAFTVPHVDALFGTDPDPAATPRSETCRTLGVVDRD